MNKETEEMFAATVRGVQELKEYLAKTGEGEGKKLMSRLVDELDVLKSGVNNIIIENEKQESEIRWLRTKITGAGEFRQKGNIYYTRGGDGPFCPFCYEKRGKRIRLMELTKRKSGGGSHKCRLCENEFDVSN